MEGVETMLLVNRVSEIFKYVGQQKNVGEKVVIVIVSHRFYVITSPNLTRPIVILRWTRLVFKGVMKCLDRRELRFREFLWAGHVRVGIDALPQ